VYTKKQLNLYFWYNLAKKSREKTLKCRLAFKGVQKHYNFKISTTLETTTI